MSLPQLVTIQEGNLPFSTSLAAKVRYPACWISIVSEVRVYWLRSGSEQVDVPTQVGYLVDPPRRMHTTGHGYKKDAQL